ncbi:MAG: ABC transporter substrate-binding protein [Sphaerochaetaceae bacterium]|jgi:branched-chain amino acid transport system substrate-binding protein
MSAKKIARLTVLFFVVLLLASPLWAQGQAQAQKENPTEFKLGFMTSFSGTFAAVAETQRMGVNLAVKEVNDAGGLNMPWGKVKVTVLEKDDEAKLDVGARRYRELKDAGMNAIVGTVWNPMAGLINTESLEDPIPYIAACVPAIETFVKGETATGTFSVAFTPWSIGYLAGTVAVKELGAKTIYWVERSDSWGSVMRQGLEAALKEHGGEIIGKFEFVTGTVDYSAGINEAMRLKPDVFLASNFSADAIALFKQAYDMGLTKVTIPFNAFITNVVGMGIPSAARADLYGLHYFYWDMENYGDPVLAKKAKDYTDAHMKAFGEAPDSYGTIAYTATQMILQAVQEAGTFEVNEVSKVIANKTFDTVKGPSYFREDHELVGDYLTYLVKGKPDSESKNKFDVFSVKGHFGGGQALPPLSMLGY